jgi:hypothetical protein
MPIDRKATSVGRAPMTFARKGDGRGSSIDELRLLPGIVVWSSESKARRSIGEPRQSTSEARQATSFTRPPVTLRRSSMPIARKASTFLHPSMNLAWLPASFGWLRESKARRSIGEPRQSTSEARQSTSFTRPPVTLRRSSMPIARKASTFPHPSMKLAWSPASFGWLRESEAPRSTGEARQSIPFARPPARMDLYIDGVRP